MTVNILRHAGVFAENKDVAAELRENVILPALRDARDVRLDFSGVEGATQSFIHALISESLREFGPDVLDHIVFKGCNDTIKQIISIVISYMQES